VHAHSPNTPQPTIRCFPLNALSRWIAVLHLGCASPQRSTEEGLWLEPGDAGPWTVGTDAFEIIGSDGLPLAVQVWYPSRQEEGILHAYGGLFTAGIALQSPAPDCTETRPVLAFSHGYTAISYQSFFLTEHLASQGWVVVAPDHRGNTFWDNSEHKIALALRRPIDIRDTVDWLFDELAGADGDLWGCVEPEAGYAISGHSFGGYTTLATAGALIDLDSAVAFCAETDEWMCGDLETWVEAGGALGVHDLGDDRVWAALPMAHAGFEVLSAGLANISVPALVMGGGLDTGTTMEDQIRPAYEAMSSAEPRYLAEIEQAGHFAFSNACEMLSGMAGDECNEDYVDPDEGHQMIRTWVSAFLQQIQGREDACDYLPGYFDDVHWEVQGLED
jgi:predicted dienelactone hydrolase